MVTKEEWLDYFELINGRKPTLDEFKRARESQNFQEGGRTHSTQLNVPFEFSKQLYEEDEKSQFEKLKKKQLLARTERESSRKNFMILAGLIVLVVLASQIWPKISTVGKVDITRDNSVLIKGFEGQGTATLNPEIYQNEERVLAKKAGFSAEEADQIASGTGSMLLTNYPEKAKTYYQLASKVQITLDNATKLSNNDSVTLTVKVTDPGIPIEALSKTYDVTELKNTSDLTNLKDLFNRMGESFDVENNYITGAYFSFYYNPTTSNYTVTVVCNFHDSSNSEDNWYRTATVTMSEDLTFDNSSLTSYYDSAHYSSEADLTAAIQKDYPNAVYLSNNSKNKI